ncbi:uncharacterized protein [Atheta coriaria]|uniref:uncharacterized protein n=1 Tax=Dalotia coriaria TaxID=877792 RepID=UPI0031F3B850
MNSKILDDVPEAPTIITLLPKSSASKNGDDFQSKLNENEVFLEEKFTIPTDKTHSKEEEVTVTGNFPSEAEFSMTTIKIPYTTNWKPTPPDHLPDDQNMLTPVDQINFQETTGISIIDQTYDKNSVNAGSTDEYGKLQTIQLVADKTIRIGKSSPDVEKTTNALEEDEITKATVEYMNDDEKDLEDVDAEDGPKGKVKGTTILMSGKNMSENSKYLASVDEGSTTIPTMFEEDEMFLNAIRVSTKKHKQHSNKSHHMWRFGKKSKTTAGLYNITSVSNELLNTQDIDDALLEKQTTSAKMFNSTTITDKLTGSLNSKSITANDITSSLNGVKEITENVESTILHTSAGTTVPITESLTTPAKISTEKLYEASGSDVENSNTISDTIVLTSTKDSATNSISATAVTDSSTELSSSSISASETKISESTSTSLSPSSESVIIETTTPFLVMGTSALMGENTSTQSYNSGSNDTTTESEFQQNQTEGNVSYTENNGHNENILDGDKNVSHNEGSSTGDVSVSTQALLDITTTSSLESTNTESATVTTVSENDLSTTSVAKNSSDSSGILSTVATAVNLKEDKSSALLEISEFGTSDSTLSTTTQQQSSLYFSDDTIKKSTLFPETSTEGSGAESLNTNVVESKTTESLSTFSNISTYTKEDSLLALQNFQSPSSLIPFVEVNSTTEAAEKTINVITTMDNSLNIFKATSHTMQPFEENEFMANTYSRNTETYFTTEQSLQSKQFANGIETTTNAIAMIDDLLKIFQSSTSPPKNLPEILKDALASAKLNQNHTTAFDLFKYLSTSPQATTDLITLDSYSTSLLNLLQDQTTFGMSIFLEPTTTTTTSKETTLIPSSTNAATSLSMVSDRTHKLELEKIPGTVSTVLTGSTLKQQEQLRTTKAPNFPNKPHKSDNFNNKLKEHHIHEAYSSGSGFKADHGKYYIGSEFIPEHGHNSSINVPTSNTTLRNKISVTDSEFKKLTNAEILTKSFSTATDTIRPNVKFHFSNKTHAEAKEERIIVSSSTFTVASTDFVGSEDLDYGNQDDSGNDTNITEISKTSVEMTTDLLKTTVEYVEPKTKTTHKHKHNWLGRKSKISTLPPYVGETVTSPDEEEDLMDSSQLTNSLIHASEYTTEEKSSVGGLTMQTSTKGVDTLNSNIPGIDSQVLDASDHSKSSTYFISSNTEESLFSSTLDNGSSVYSEIISSGEINNTSVNTETTTKKIEEIFTPSNIDAEKPISETSEVSKIGSESLILSGYTGSNKETKITNIDSETTISETYSISNIVSEYSTFSEYTGNNEQTIITNMETETSMPETSIVSEIASGYPTFSDYTSSKLISSKINDTIVSNITERTEIFKTASEILEVVSTSFMESTVSRYDIENKISSVFDETTGLTLNQDDVTDFITDIFLTKTTLPTYDLENKTSTDFLETTALSENQGNITTFIADILLTETSTNMSMESEVTTTNENQPFFNSSTLIEERSTTLNQVDSLFTSTTSKIDDQLTTLFSSLSVYDSTENILNSDVEPEILTVAFYFKNATSLGTAFFPSSTSNTSETALINISEIPSNTTHYSEITISTIFNAPSADLSTKTETEISIGNAINAGAVNITENVSTISMTTENSQLTNLNFVEKMISTTGSEQLMSQSASNIMESSSKLFEGTDANRVTVTPVIMLFTPATGIVSNSNEDISFPVNIKMLLEAAENENHASLVSVTTDTAITEGTGITDSTKSDVISTKLDKTEAGTSITETITIENRLETATTLSSSSTRTSEQIQTDEENSGNGTPERTQSEGSQNMKMVDLNSQPQTSTILQISVTTNDATESSEIITTTTKVETSTKTELPSNVNASEYSTDTSRLSTPTSSTLAESVINHISSTTETETPFSELTTQIRTEQFTNSSSFQTDSSFSSTEVYYTNALSNTLENTKLNMNTSSNLIDSHSTDSLTSDETIFSSVELGSSSSNTEYATSTISAIKSNIVTEAVITQQSSTTEYSTQSAEVSVETPSDTLLTSSGELPTNSDVTNQLAQSSTTLHSKTSSSSASDSSTMHVNSTTEEISYVTNARLHYTELPITKPQETTTEILTNAEYATNTSTISTIASIQSVFTQQSPTTEFSIQSTESSVEIPSDNLTTSSEELFTNSDETNQLTQSSTTLHSKTSSSSASQSSTLHINSTTEEISYVTNARLHYTELPITKPQETTTEILTNTEYATNTSTISTIESIASIQSVFTQQSPTTEFSIQSTESTVEIPSDKLLTSSEELPTNADVTNQLTQSSTTLHSKTSSSSASQSSTLHINSTTEEISYVTNARLHYTDSPITKPEEITSQILTNIGSVVKDISTDKTEFSQQSDITKLIIGSSTTEAVYTNMSSTKRPNMPKVLFSTNGPVKIEEQNQNLNMHHMPHNSPTSTPTTTKTTANLSTNMITEGVQENTSASEAITKFTSTFKTKTSSTSSNETCRYTPVDRSNIMTMLKRTAEITNATKTLSIETTTTKTSAATTVSTTASSTMISTPTSTESITPGSTFTSTIPSSTTSLITTTSAPKTSSGPTSTYSLVTIANVAPTCNGDSSSHSKPCNIDKDQHTCICSVDSIVKDLQEKSRYPNINSVLTNMCEIYIPLNSTGIKVGRCANRQRRNLDDYDMDAQVTQKPKREVIASVDIKDALSKDIDLEETEAHKFATIGSTVRMICADGKNFSSKDYNMRWTIGKDTPLTGSKTQETVSGDLIIANIEPSDGGTIRVQ